MQKPILLALSAFVLLVSACPEQAGAGEGEGEGGGTEGFDIGSEEGSAEEGTSGEGGDEGEGDREGSDHCDRPEICSFEDEDCDGENNEDLDCTFFAHTDEAVVRVDPFAEEVTELDFIGTLYDIDRHPDGRVLGVTSDGELVEITDAGVTPVIEVDLPTDTNGMAITSEGVIYVTASDSAYILDEATGDLTTFGSIDGGTSSGDCVITKDGRLLVSVIPDFALTDDLVSIDQATGESERIGSLGYTEVYGLSASFGHLFGVTGNGRVLLIDPASGEADNLFFSGETFYGAANGD